MTRRNSILIFAALFVLIVPAAAFAKPNFTGTWKFNPEKSDFSTIPPPQDMVRKITHDEPSLKWSQTQSIQQKEVTTEMTYTTDGKTSTNTTQAGQVTGKAKWDGNVLTINSTREARGMEITQSERWMLSDDGKVLIITNKVKSPNGEFDVKLVLDKQ